MSTAQNLNNLNTAITLLLSITAQAGRVSAAIAAARASGGGLSDQQLAELQASDDVARAGLVASIEAAKAG
jgi:hypothetical protein